MSKANIDKIDALTKVLSSLLAELKAALDSDQIFEVTRKLQTHIKLLETEIDQIHKVDPMNN